jgi:hypothetical protein
MTKEEKRELTAKGRSSGKDNLKTMSDSRRARSGQYLIRRFIGKN